jgi:hypothetical protein
MLMVFPLTIPTILSSLTRMQMIPQSVYYSGMLETIKRGLPISGLEKSFARELLMG